MERLTQYHLPLIGRKAALPTFDREATGIGIVHLGIGAFHRAHQACYTQAAMDRCGGNWGIVGVSLRSASVRDNLATQDCLYSVAIRHHGATSLQLIAAIKQVLVAPEQPRAVIDALALAAVRVVTLTITEKGYCLHHPGGLDFTHPDIAHDLLDLQTPVSAIGFVVAGLRQRKLLGLRGVSLVSCDNLSANGKKLQSAVLQFADRIDADLAAWISRHCTFPCSMVDRIVPATTEADREQIAAQLGLQDTAAVVTEPFSQWVLEDNFADEIPAWAQVGVTLVPSVTPFEEMKLRLLNASHSTLAYLGCLAGFSTVADVLRDTAFRRLVQQLMQTEAAPTLTGLENFDVAAYGQQLIERFSNAGLRHFVRQIAMDGSQKIPQRFLPALRWQLQHSGNIDALTLGLAAWIRYTRGVDERGEVFAVQDPLSADFAKLHGRAGQAPRQYLPAMLALDGVFDADLAGNSTLTEKLLFWLERLERDGALATVHRHWGETGV